MQAILAENRVIFRVNVINNSELSSEQRLYILTFPGKVQRFVSYQRRNGGRTFISLDNLFVLLSILTSRELVLYLLFFIVYVHCRLSIQDVDYQLSTDST